MVRPNHASRPSGPQLPIEVRGATKTAVTASRVINLRITGPSVSMSAIYLRTIGHGEHAP